MAASAPRPSSETPPSDPPSQRHEQTVRRFVELWGEMGSSWGINRTMAQIHALLYCVEEPLNTDQIMERLDISRGNANMNLRSLTDWGLVAKTRKTGSRKDYYAAEKDVWQITEQIIRERERREVQPVKKELQACMDTLVPESESLEDRPEADRVLHHRLREFLELMEVFEGFTAALLPLVQHRELSMIQQLIGLARRAGDDSDEVSGSVSPETRGAAD
jgi:DNA-binding transcriptional regulator GbsR (MarR family)